MTGVFVWYYIVIKLNKMSPPIKGTVSPRGQIVDGLANLMWLPEAG